MPEDTKFPTEVVDLPSQGQVYPEDSPLSSGKIELKYMTAKEEDILTSQNLIQKGIVIEQLINSLIVDKTVKSQDLILGDKNAVMVAARVLAYGADYQAEATNPDSGEKELVTFDLTSCKFKELPDDVDYSSGEFSFQLPTSETNITFRLVTGKEENLIDKDIAAMKKMGTSAEVTTRFRHVITSVEGNNEPAQITSFVNNMLSKDSLELRREIARVSPDIEMTQEVEIGGDTVEVEIPLTVEFFWPTV